MAAVDAPTRPQPVTLSAPHLRDAMSVRTAINVFMVSLIPPTAMAVYNTGYEANLAMERLGVGAAPGWRGQPIDLLGSGYDVSTPVAAVVHGAVYFLPALLVVIAAGAIWTWLFAMGRGRRMGPGVLGIALVVTLMLPPTMPLWLAAQGMSFGIVLGPEIFGGFVRNVLNPAFDEAEYFELDPDQARSIAAEVGAATATWRDEAARLGLTHTEIERMASAFAHDDLTSATAY